MQLNAIGTADWKSGYVFGMSLNFDGELNADEIQTDALAIGDSKTAPPFRKYARLWLPIDYIEAVEDAKTGDAVEAATKATVGPCHQ